MQKLSRDEIAGLASDLFDECARSFKRIAELEAAMAKAADIIDRNLYHQREKVKDASAILRAELTK